MIPTPQVIPFKDGTTCNCCLDPCSFKVIFHRDSGADLSLRLCLRCASDLRWELKRELHRSAGIREESA